MADGGAVDDIPEPDPKAAAQVQKGATESGWQPGQWAKNIKEGLGMAHGGMMHDDLVDRVIKRHYSEGGMVANGGEDDFEQLADSRPNNFDDLSLRDHLESTNSGAADGDFLGNEAEDEHRRDIVARIMRQRMMKQHNPRPA